jgi:cell division transport system permease protein
MKINTFRIFSRDAIQNIWRNSWMSLASISSVVAVLVIIGLILIFMVNIQYVASIVEDTIELKAFLEVDIGQDEINGIKAQLETNEKIDNITFESKEQALEKFSEQIGDRKDLISGLEENNPLQNSFILSIKDPSEANVIAETIANIEGVEEVKYGEEVVDKVLQSTKFIRTFTIIITLILATVSIFIISNTIKLTVFSRKKEINIMKYVGATNWYVRWPFLIEGAILGLIGALFSLLLLGYSYYYFTGMAQNTALSIISNSLVPAGEMISQITLYFIIAGVVIGVVGSILSIRRFLRV